MRFAIDYDLLAHARTRLSKHRRLYWLVGGAGAGKSTVCRALSATFDLPIYDMDAHIYGDYHGRFAAHHPTNRAWAAAPNSLAWLLSMAWEEFDQFNQAALPEYLDLAAADLATPQFGRGVLIDGGICNPALLAQAVPAAQIVCLVAPEQPGAGVWQPDGERGEMKTWIDQLPDPQRMWETFLAFDARITQTMIEESRAGGIAICARQPDEAASAFAQRVSRVLGMVGNSPQTGRT